MFSGETLTRISRHRYGGQLNSWCWHRICLSSADGDTYTGSEDSDCHQNHLTSLCYCWITDNLFRGNFALTQKFGSQDQGNIAVKKHVSRDTSGISRQCSEYSPLLSRAKQPGTSGIMHSVVTSEDTHRWHPPGGAETWLLKSNVWSYIVLVLEKIIDNFI